MSGGLLDISRSTRCESLRNLLILKCGSQVRCRVGESNWNGEAVRESSTSSVCRKRQVPETTMPGRDSAPIPMSQFGIRPSEQRHENHAANTRDVIRNICVWTSLNPHFSRSLEAIFAPTERWQKHLQITSLPRSRRRMSPITRFGLRTVATLCLCPMRAVLLSVLDNWPVLFCCTSCGTVVSCNLTIRGLKTRTL